MHHGQRRSSRVGLLERQLCHESLEDRLLLATDLLASFESQLPFSSRPQDLFTAGNNAFFQADFSFGGGNQLWRTDGTPEGTISLNHEGVIREYVEVDGKYVFLAADQTIRASDGTPQSTTILATESTLGDVSTQVVKTHARRV